MGAKVIDNVLLALKASFLSLVLKIVIECSIMEWENDRKMDTGFRAKVVEQFGG